MEEFFLSLGIIFSVLMVLLIFIYAIQFRQEAFEASRQTVVKVCEENRREGVIRSPKDVNFVQGATVPLKDFSTRWEDDGNLPSVDGSKQAPHSMAMLSFNNCSPDCCPSAYSCAGGCVCETTKQNEFMSSRGGNRTKGEEEI